MKKRILELTEYLRSVNSGEGVVLCRNEDAFSHLEDEMYKTVMSVQRYPMMNLIRIWDLPELQTLRSLPP